MKGHILGYSVTASGLAGPPGALAREWWLAQFGARGNLNFGRSEATITVVCLR